MIRAILVAPDPILFQKCEPVVAFDETLAQLVLDLRETMTSVGAAGLAAPQIGVPLRVFVMGTKAAFINPRIVQSSVETWVEREGCLSLPSTCSDDAEAKIPVKRAWGVRIGWQNFRGEPRETLHEGWEARCALHELDHLDGLLITDRSWHAEADADEIEGVQVS